jgi:general secretion pathway protein D
MRTLRTTLMVMVGLAPAVAIAQAPPTTPPTGTGSSAPTPPAPVGPGKRPSLGLKPGDDTSGSGEKGRVGNGKAPAPAAGDKGAGTGGGKGGAAPTSDGKNDKPGPGKPQPPPIRPGAGGNTPPPFAAPPAGNPTPPPPALTDGLPAENAVNIVCGKPLPSGKKFKWSLRGDVELKNLVEWASTFLCHPVIVPENLRKQKVTIYAPDEITSEEARRMFYATLNSMGLTIQPQGSRGREVFTVIESQNAHTSSVPFLGTEAQPPANDAYVTKLMRLKNAGPDEMVTVLNRLKSKDGDVIPFPATQSLLITDSGENIRRMEEVIKQLDQQPLGGDKVWTVKLHNVAASEMAAILEKIFPKPGAAAGGAPGGAPKSHVTLTTPGAPGGGGGANEAMGLSVTQIVPEDRSNTLIIVANEKTYQYVVAIIRRLDQSGGPMDNSMDRVHVYSLANANAEDISATLSGLGIGVSRGRTGAAGAPGAPAAPRPATPTGATGTTGGAGATLFEGAVQIAPDKPTNSLVIVASGRDYLVVRDLIRKLDIARRQVFIEATILEVSLDKSRKLGAAFHAGDTVFSGDQQSLLFGGSEPNQAVNSILFSPAALSGLAAGLRGPNIPGAAQILGLPPGTSIPEFGVFVQALQNNNDVNVVSMPHILTTDNEKATIQVGQNLPFPGSLGGFPGAGAALPGAAPGAAPGGFGLGFGTSVQRQDVSLKLDCTPHVNDSDFVRLELDAEISDVAAENFNGLGPATNKRTAKTVVVVRDQQAVVIGGLVKDRIAESVDKVPLLGDIPILGYLFKYTRKTLTKQNLLIILTPYVIKDPADLRRIFERKVRERKEFLERYSAFQDPNNYDPAIDYRRKRGLLEEINRTAVEAEIEAAEIRAAETALHGRQFEGPVDPNAPPPPPPRSRLPQPQPNVIFEPVQPGEPPQPAPPIAPPDVGGNE